MTSVEWSDLRPSGDNIELVLVDPCRSPQDLIALLTVCAVDFGVLLTHVGRMGEEGYELRRLVDLDRTLELIRSSDPCSIELFGTGGIGYPADNRNVIMCEPRDGGFVVFWAANESIMAYGTPAERDAHWSNVIAAFRQCCAAIRPQYGGIEASIDLPGTIEAVLGNSPLVTLSGWYLSQDLVRDVYELENRVGRAGGVFDASADGVFVFSCMQYSTAFMPGRRRPDTGEINCAVRDALGDGG